MVALGFFCVAFHATQIITKEQRYFRSCREIQYKSNELDKYSTKYPESISENLKLKGFDSFLLSFY